MKKLFALLLVVVLLFSLSACSQYKTPIENLVLLDRQYGQMQRIPITISAAEQREIAAILNAGNWIENDVNSMSDYEFTIDGMRMAYMVSGHFRDYGRRRGGFLLVLSEEYTQRVNKILGFEG